MLDTNIILDWLFDRDEIRSAQIDALFKTSDSLVVPDPIVVELAFALEKFYELPRSLVADNLNKVIDEPVLDCNRMLFRRTIEEYLQHPAWSFLDSYLLQYAQQQKTLPVWTFDKKLITQSSGKAKAPDSPPRNR